jgi:hypothetical protein
MTVRDMARSYLRYWSPRGDGGMDLADNAPSALWRFAFATKDSIDRSSLYMALRTLANGDQIPTPSTSVALKWFAARPDTLRCFDEILRNTKRPAATFAELVERAYLAAQQDTVGRVREFITSEISNAT